MGDNLEKVDDEKKDSKPETKLFCFDNRDQKLNDVNIDLDTLNMIDHNFKFDKTGNLMFIGTYSIDKTKSRRHFLVGDVNYLDGAFCYTYSKNLDATIKKDTRNLNEVFSEKNKLFTTNKLNYFLKDVTVFENGSVGLVCEKKETLTFAGSSGSGLNRTTTTEINYEFKGVLVFNMNCNPKDYWVKFIDKSQKSFKSDVSSNNSIQFHSIVCSSTDKKVNILVNSRKIDGEFISSENQTAVNLGEFENEGSTYKFSFDEAGKVTVKDLFKNELNQPLMRTNDRIDKVILLKNNTLFFPATGVNGLQYGKIILE